MPNNGLVLEHEQLFFAPVQSDAIDLLIASFKRAEKNIHTVADFIAEHSHGALAYFAEGSRVHASNAGYHTTSFNRDWALAALNSEFWQRAINLTDVLKFMPQKRRDEWNKAIREHTTPVFTEESARATLTQLLLDRGKFFAERVDGIFRALSGEHITNSPMGFRKRMILNRVYCEWGSVNTSQAGYINDLRAVIAKFMGRDEPDWYVTSRCLDKIPKNGQWHALDGGSLRIRLYKRGTAHIEIHPDMSWRLNCVLANLYPTAIPAEFRKRSTKPIKDFDLLQKPLPFQIINVLVEMSTGKNRHSRSLPMNKDNALKNQAADVLKALGGVDTGHYVFEFDYDPSDVINHVIVTGCIPDHKSHQFYPTPTSLAEVAIGLADIEETDFCLEPSAGQAGLAKLLPIDRTDCVEISALHCRILDAKGFSVDQGDFLTWPGKGKQYEKVVLNPPFSENRWKSHVEQAGKFVKPGGRLVAILPSIAKTYVLEGFACEYHGPYENEFAGTGVSVVILVADKI